MDKSTLATECEFKTVKSSGSGGQHVNKVNTKVQLFHKLQDSYAFTSVEKTKLLSKLSGKLSDEGYILIEDQSTRSQLRNKENSIKKLEKLYLNTLNKKEAKSKKRFHVKNKRERLKNKKHHSDKKKLRKPPDY